MRLAGGLLRIVSMLLLLLVGSVYAVPVAAGQTDEDEFSEVAGDDNVFDANDEGFVSEDLDGDGTNEIGFDEDQSGTLEENEALGTDVNDDEALTQDEFDPSVATTGAGTAAGATPVTDTLGVFGDDERFDANDEGFVSEDLDGDGTNEIGFDEDQSGTLEENEVLGSDFDNDEGLGAPLSDGAAAGAEDATAAGAGDFASIAGDDNVFDANDEGFVSEDLDGDGTNEIGFDEDASGTLEENEVLGTDENDDQALTEDESGT